MHRRRTWIAVACGLLVVLGMIIGLAAPGCGGGDTLHACPNPRTGIYDPDCCALFNEGCDVPCVVPGADLEACQQFWCAACPGEAATTPGSNCLDWVKEYCPADAGTDNDGATGCAGDCVPLPPFDWQGPALFLTGPAGSPPECPSNAPVTATLGFTDAGEQPDAGCTSCGCGRATAASCAPPTHIFASALPCSAGAPLSAPFDPPAPWDGGCTANDPVAANADCGGSPCVASIVAGPLVDNGCVPVQAVPVDAGPPGWGTEAVACVGSMDPLGACTDHGQTCTPSAPPSSGFLTCIFQDGDNPCPDGSPYTDRHVVYEDFQDQRGCTACSCGAADMPCTAQLGVFQDSTCNMVLLDASISSAGQSCFDLPDAGPPLGSKDVMLLPRSGVCLPSGGEPTDGGFVPSGAATFCCLTNA
jgi:hypothetical protein